MKLIRMTLAGLMALLVSMPLAVCKEDCGTQASTCEESCCGEHVADSCDCGCLEICPKVQYESRDVLASSSEVPVPEAPEQAAGLLEVEPETLFIESLVMGAERLRAPPDPFARSSRQITHCVFRL